MSGIKTVRRRKRVQKKNNEALDQDSGIDDLMNSYFDSIYEKQGDKCLVDRPLGVCALVSLLIIALVFLIHVVGGMTSCIDTMT